MVRDRPGLAIALMVGFAILAPAGDAVAKLLSPGLPLGLLLAARFGVQAAVLLPLAAAGGGTLRLSRCVWALNSLRTLLALGGVSCMYLSLRFLPLADALAIVYVMPFLTLGLAAFFLGEAVGRRRVTACIVGFSGALLVIEPRFAEVGPAVLLPLAAAFLFALFMVLTRVLAPRATPMALQATSGLMALAMLAVAGGAAVILMGQGGATWVAPGGPEIALLALMGALSTGAHLFVAASLRHAPAAAVSPVQYLELPVAAGLGLWLFGDLPGPAALAGMALIALSGLAVLRGETRVRA